MSEILTNEGQVCETDKLTFGHLREMNVGESKVFKFAEEYTPTKARNLCNTYKNFYGNAKFSVISQEDGKVCITRTV